MQIVPEILKKVELAGAQVLAVTKYFSPAETQEICNALKKKSVVLALGENRIAPIREKNIPRDFVHFIGNIQSRDIPDIAQYCSVVHSLCSVKHAELFAKQEVPPSVFIQVNISGESQKSGISPESLSDFLLDIAHLNLDILGISAMGSAEFTEEQKQKEFKMLCQIRDQYLPEKLISAGTSRDFEIALTEGIEIVRIGQALWRMKT